MTRKILYDLAAERMRPTSGRSGETALRVRASQAERLETAIDRLAQRADPARRRVGDPRARPPGSVQRPLQHDHAGAVRQPLPQRRVAWLDIVMTVVVAMIVRMVMVVMAVCMIVLMCSVAVTALCRAMRLEAQRSDGALDLGGRGAGRVVLQRPDAGETAR